MNLSRFMFNTAAGCYNAKKPFIVVNIADDAPTRGDTHGYVGMAQRVAEVTDGEYLFVDQQTLENMYPNIKQKGGTETDNDARLMALFKDKGVPDFYFSRFFNDNVNNYMSRYGHGIHIKGVNEHLPGLLGLQRKDEYDSVPHHLTPDLLAFEGEKFAHEFAELPRPFIGVLVAINNDEETEALVEKLAKLKHAYQGASIFICSSHRTKDHSYDRFVSDLKSALNNDAHFPVIDFNFNQHMDQEGKDNFWNPYIGLLDQSDHVVMLGRSRSMESEVMATGKRLHTADTVVITPDMLPFFRKKFAKSIYDYEDGAPLVTDKLDALNDGTGLCAQAISKLHDTHVATCGNRFTRAIKKLASEVKPSLAKRNFKPL